DAARERRRIRVEVPDDRARGSAEDLDLRTRPGVEADDDVAERVTVHVPDRDEQPAGECRRPGDEFAQHHVADAIEDPYDRRAPRPGRRHDVRHAVAVDVSHRDANAAAERPLVREEASVERARPEPRYERSDVRAAARARPGRGE